MARRAALALPALAAAAYLGFLAAPASGRGLTTITVVAGKPSEYRFTVSATSVLTGSITIKIVNRGKVKHSFSIVGETTPPIAPGKSATLTVAIVDAGTYPFFSTLKGQSSMRGTLKVVEPAPKSTSSTIPLQQGAGEPTVAPPDGPCANPVATTVKVQMIDFGFILSQTTFPCGTVTFQIQNAGQAAHTFDIQSTTPSGIKAFNGGKTLLGGETDTEVITFSRTGTFQYQCDIHGQEFSMNGQVAVTG
ncbi:MAG: cupredoxin domain-containing protein [Actinobacteria bacterium]|nr:cupredoxin domain-containing protein [Actinomycetota bacterium]MBV8599665.1 cupredoxin domain-containing protein [Actinomycetota bacterium]